MKVKLFERRFTIIVVLMFLFVGSLNILNVTSERNDPKTRNGNGVQEWSEPDHIETFDYRLTPGPSSIAIDSDGDWHIVYPDLIRYQDHSERTFVRYISNTTTEVLAEEYGNIMDKTGEGVGDPSIAFDSNGGIHVIYVQWFYNDTNNKSIMYTTKESGENIWSSPQKITTFNYYYQVPTPASIALDSNGDWHIVYSDRDCYEDNSETRYVKHITETTTETLAEEYGNQNDKTGEGVGQPSITIDSNNQVHITFIQWPYSDISCQSIMYINKDTSSSSWSAPEKITTFGYCHIPSPTSIAVDLDGDWHIVYPDRILYEDLHESTFVKYINRTSTEILAEEFGNLADKTGKGIGHPSIALDPEGGLHVIYVQWDYEDRYNQSIQYILKEAPHESPSDTEPEPEHEPEPDSDQDGLPDDWELSYFGDLSQDANDDFDGDGKTNLEEYEGGTDPTVAPTEPPPKKDGSILDYWWVFLILIVLCIVFVAALLLRRKPPPLPYSAPPGEKMIPARYDVYR